MPTPVRRLTLAGAKDLIASLAQPDSTSAGGVGLEVELIPTQPHGFVSRALADVDWPGGSRLTFEPGGQVELSGPCLPSASAVCTAMDADLAAMAARGVVARAIGMDPAGGRPRVLQAARYEAMEVFFDHAGRTMMRDTAAMQVNVDAGDDRRWRAVHALGPVLAAAFANSPLCGGEANGWRSNRGRIWLAIDASRTAPVGGRTTASWVDYAMAARVMLVRATPTRYVAARGGMTLADWVEHGHAAGWPDEDDVAYHLTTLFPPVRPRGWLELRFLDALPAPWWQVAVHAVCKLLDDPDTVEAACAGTAGLWYEAARFGVAHPGLGAAAEACLATVPEAAEFVDRFTTRRRCPGDELLVPASA